MAVRRVLNTKREHGDIASAVMGTDFSHAFGFAGASTFPCCPKAVMVPAATVSVQGQCSGPRAKQRQVVGRKEPMEDLGETGAFLAPQ